MPSMDVIFLILGSECGSVNGNTQGCSMKSVDEVLLDVWVGVLRCVCDLEHIVGAYRRHSRCFFSHSTSSPCQHLCLGMG